MVNRNGAPDDRTKSVRAEPGSMYAACSAIGDDAPTEGNSADGHSSRAEQTAAPHPALSIGGAARRAAADLFHAVLTDRWARGDDSASNRVLADRYLEVDEKQVRQYRDGRKHVPLAALMVLPVPIVRELVERVLAARGVGERDDIATLRQTIARLKQRRVRDRAEVLGAVLDAQRELLDLARDLAEAK